MRRLLIPAQPSRVTLQHLTVGRIVAGSVLTGLGLVFTITGAAFVGTTDYSIGGQNVQYSAGVPLLFAGGGFLIGGIINLAMIRGSSAALAPDPH